MNFVLACGVFNPAVDLQAKLDSNYLLLLKARIKMQVIVAQKQFA